MLRRVSGNYYARGRRSLRRVGSLTARLSQNDAVLALWDVRDESAMRRSAAGIFQPADGEEVAVLANAKTLTGKSARAFCANAESLTTADLNYFGSGTGYNDILGPDSLRGKRDGGGFGRWRYMVSGWYWISFKLSAHDGGDPDITGLRLSFYDGTRTTNLDTPGTYEMLVKANARFDLSTQPGYGWRIDQLRIVPFSSSWNLLAAADGNRPLRDGGLSFDMVDDALAAGDAGPSDAMLVWNDAGTVRNTQVDTSDGLSFPGDVTLSGAASFPIALLDQTNPGYAEALTMANSLGQTLLPAGGDDIANPGEPVTEILPQELQAAMAPDFLDSNRFPATASTAANGVEGLANLFGFASAAEAQAAGKVGTLGVDFGHVTARESLADAGAKYGKYLTTASLRVRNNSAPNNGSNFLLEGFCLTDLYVHHDLTDPALTLTIRDFRVEQTQWAAGERAIFSARQLPSNATPGKFLMENGVLTGAALKNAYVTNGTIRNCYFYSTPSDQLSGGSDDDDPDGPNRSLRIYGSLFRLGGDPMHPDFSESSHVDGAQIYNPHNMLVAGSVIYVPDPESPFAESGAGVNAALASAGCKQSANCIVVGSVLAGNKCLQIGMKLDATYFRNWIVANNLFGAGGNGAGGSTGAAVQYSRGGEISLSIDDQGTEVRDTPWENIIFLRNRGSDGYPVRLSGNALPDAKPGELAYGPNGLDWQMGPEDCVAFGFDWSMLDERGQAFVLAFEVQHGIQLVDPDTKAWLAIDGGRLKTAAEI